MIEEIQKLKARSIGLLQKIHQLEQDLKGQEAAQRDAIRQIIMTVILLLDELKREEQLAGAQPGADPGSIAARYRPLREILDRILLQNNVQKMRLPLPNIPELCTVVRTVSDTHLPDGHIVAIEVDGYLLGDLVIRPADVVAVQRQK